MRLFFYLTTIIAINLPSIALAQTTKERILQCRDAKLASLRTRINFERRGGVTCPQGDIVGFPPSCRKHNRNGAISYTIPSGHKLITSSVSDESRTNGTGRSGVKQSGSNLTVSLSCTGHGCDGKGRRWVNSKLYGTIERIPTEKERAKALADCLTEILP